MTQISGISNGGWSLYHSGAAASLGTEREGSLVQRDDPIDDIDQYERSFDPIQLDYID